MATLSLRRVSKSFARARALDNITLDIASGEFFSIVGPSGCGKTTLLRLIAGFDKPDTGSILIDDRDITSMPAQSRNVGMVFQNYALFPHMTVGGNVAFGLETRGDAKGEIERRVTDILAAVGLGPHRDRPVTTLSGGEQQRVAVARALVVEPSILLFDEPLSNLDMALRHQTREEIRSLQRKTGITSVYVTHDQAEAMSLSDRVAVIRAGILEQVGTPSEVYESPATPFVAGFLGGANLIQGTVDGRSQRFTAGDFSMGLTAPMPEGGATVAVRPELVRIGLEGNGGVPGVIESVEYLGFTTNVLVSAGGIPLRSFATSSPFLRSLRPGDRVVVSIDWEKCTIFPEAGP